MDVAPNTIAIWSDIGCARSHAVIWRLHDARRRLDLDGRVAFDHHAFPLELFNSEPNPRPRFDADWPMAAEEAPRAGWQAWSAPDTEWPVTLLPPMEAVIAARAQSLAASEQLDRGLRRALFAESRCISLRHVILEVANECDSIDVSRLADALDAGTARRALFDDYATASGGEVRGSAHLFAPDGTNAQNPDGAAMDDLLRRAAG
jgi:predicted DsbA family dithiol-disulfide isomerase